MTTYQFNIIDLGPEEFYKLYGGTDGYNPILEAIKPLINRPDYPINLD